MNEKEFTTLLAIQLPNWKFNPPWGKWTLDSKTHTKAIAVAYRIYPGCFYIDGLSASIRFNEIEIILKKYTEKYLIEQNYGNSTIQKVLNGLDGIDYSLLKKEIHDKNTFTEIAIEIDKIITYGAMPFLINSKH